MSDGLFTPLFVPDETRDAVGVRAWLGAMLEAEGALAVAQARAGLIPTEAAEAIAGCCHADRFDPEEIGRAGRAAGNPVPALVKALTAVVSEVSEEAARHVHKGATSQDVTDTAAMLVSRRALDLILAEVGGIASACAALADDHRGTGMPGRTLLQQALPVTFGLKAAGWLVSVLEARRRLTEVRASGLAAQLGGRRGRSPRSATPASACSRSSRWSSGSRSRLCRGTRTEPGSPGSGAPSRFSRASSKRWRWT